MSAEYDERTALLEFLEYQRASVRSIVEGLSEADWHTSVVPSGWTPAGFVEHLGGAEHHWFQEVIAGVVSEPPADEEYEPYDPDAAFTSSLSSEEVLRGYLEECQRSNAVLEGVTMSTVQLGRHGDLETPNVRWVVLHMIEETAAHSGHLEIARELLDGQTKRGQR